MTDWDSLWRLAPDGLLLDENGDGLADGTGACIVPLTPALFTPAVWAGCANLAVRIGLESPALRLPVAVALDAIEPWQTPIFVSSVKFPDPVQGTLWAGAALHTLNQFEGGHAAWLNLDGRRALWVHASAPHELADVLNSMACANLEGVDEPVKSERQGSPAMDLTRLYSTEPGGLFLAGQDGFTPVDTCFQLCLSAQSSVADSYAVIDLAARVGLETAGATLPLVSTCEGEAEQPRDGFTLCMRAKEDATTGDRLAPESDGLALTAATARYLACTYPYLTEDAQQRGGETETMPALIAVARQFANGHPPAMKSALALVQSGGVLPVELSGAEKAANSLRQVFRYEWEPADGEDNISRIRRLAREIVLPYEAERGDHGDVERDRRRRLTLFCSAPLAARRNLATEIEDALRSGDRQLQVRVLPVHKSALAWVLEEQIPLLGDLDVASIDLYFSEFRPAEGEHKWLDLPTRWLQEWFPVKDLVQRSLGLAADDVNLHMTPADEAANCADGMLPAYRLIANDTAGTPVHEDDLYTLYDERTYLAGMPDYGLVHPSTAGAILRGVDDPPRAWHTATDEELFWDFYQQTILPAVRAHVLEVSGGRPTPDNEPYFERVEVEGFFGWPDEELGISEEFVSVGEALHEDVYFNTLDYLAALGEQYCGRPIVAAGQVIPLIHDYMRADGSLTPRKGARAVVTLQAWHVPLHLPAEGLVVGDARDLPKPRHIGIGELTLDATQAKVERAVVDLQYASQPAALFAGNVFSRWQALTAQPYAFPNGVDVVLRCMVGPKVVAEIAVDGTKSKDGEASAEPPRVDSAVIGPRQLEERLGELAGRPEITVWEVGRSYQGRTGYAVDLHLPLASGQTHHSRLKLALQKPTCFIIARHHANEVSSTTAALEMMDELTSDPTMRTWLERLNLVFLPMANPDGAATHYRLMAEHPRWKHHAARFNAAGMEFSIDTFNPDTAFGEARFRREMWLRWLPDAVVDNHGVPSHEWCQPFAGYNSPPRFPVSYHVVQAMIYGIIAYVDDPGRPGIQAAAEALRSAVAKAVAAETGLHEQNQFWLKRYDDYGHSWLPETSPKDVHQGMLFFLRGMDRRGDLVAWRNFALLHPEITLVDWITEVPDETVQGDMLRQCAAAHRTANLAMMRLVADSAQPARRTVRCKENGDVHVSFSRERRIEASDGS